MSYLLFPSNLKWSNISSKHNETPTILEHDSTGAKIDSIMHDQIIDGINRYGQLLPPWLDSYSFIDVARKYGSDETTGTSRGHGKSFANPVEAKLIAR
jgi:hypothetical protein